MSYQAKGQRLAGRLGALRPASVLAVDPVIVPIRDDEIPFGPDPATMALETDTEGPRLHGFKFLPEVLRGRGELAIPPLDELTVLIFGTPGVGKTSLVAGRPDTMFISTEPGTSFLRVPSVQVRDWATFEAVIDELVWFKARGDLPYRSVAIDIVDNLAGYCLDAVCRAKGVTYPPENDFGKTWKQIRLVWEDKLRLLMDTVGVSFLTHCATEKRETKGRIGTIEIDCVVPTFRGNKQAQYLDGIVDAMGYVHKNAAGQHVINFQNRPNSAAKDRTGVLSSLGDIVIQAPNADPSVIWSMLSDAYLTNAKTLGFTVKAST